MRLCKDGRNETPKKFDQADRRRPSYGGVVDFLPHLTPQMQRLPNVQPSGALEESKLNQNPKIHVMNNRIVKFALTISVVLLIMGMVSCVGAKKGRYENCSHFSSNQTKVNVQ